MTANEAAEASAVSLADDDLLRALLREDVPYGDLTTAALGLAPRRCRATLAARGAMVAAGVEEAARLFSLCGAWPEVVQVSGTCLAARQPLLRATGRAAGIFAAWKTAQTLVEAMSGIASSVARLTAAARASGREVPVACTRKNFPGTRTFSARAVVAGGGILHRLGLSETVLVFPQHLRFVDPGARADALTALKRAQPEKRVVVEVTDRDDALAWARIGADVLQLERFPPADVLALRAVLEQERRAVLLAPCGGITEANASDYARAGADLLVTSAPYFAPPADVEVSIAPLDPA